METGKMKLALSAGAIALSMALVGCGGGGSSGPSSMMENEEKEQPEQTTTTETMTHKVDLPEDRPTTGYVAPMASDTVTVAAGETEQLGSSSIQVMCPDDGDACEITVDANGDIQSSVEGAEASLTEAADKLLMAENEGIKDRIIGKDRALENPGLVSGTAATGLDLTDFSVYRGPSAAARIKVSGFGASDTPALSNGDWAGKRLTRKTATATEHLVVYSDIEAPGRVQFYNFDGSVATPDLYDGEIQGRGSGTPPIPAVNTRYTSESGIYPLVLVSSTGPNASLFNDDNLDSHFMSPGPAAGGTKRQTFSQSAYQGGEISFQGDFNGASGTYACAPANSGTSCQVEISTAGVYTPRNAGDVWTFEPELNATAWRQDRAHVNFGWWLSVPDSQNNAYNFQYFHNGGGSLSDYNDGPTDEARSPTGTATYNGRAAGHYVVQEVGDTGVTGGMHGEFTAAATLNATFGTNNNLLSGTISGFSGDNPDLISGWSVRLHQKALGAIDSDSPTTTDWAFSAATNITPTSPDYQGVTATMGDETAHGDWTAQYYGSSTGAAEPNAQPLSVGGVFQADNDKVSIAGAFGASR